MKNTKLPAIQETRGHSGKNTHALGSFLTATLLAVCLCIGTSLANAAQRDMNIVAHQDDDILFMNPDIAHAIQGNHSILTVFLTAGDAGIGPAYMVTREQAARAGYATMAGVPDSDSSWTTLPVNIAGVPFVKMEQMKRAKGKAPIYLVFLRLPAGSEAGLSYDRNPYDGNLYESLRMLWLGSSPTIDSLYDPSYVSDPTDTVNGQPQPFVNQWNKAGLVTTLTNLMIWFNPTVIRSADSTGHTLVPDGPAPDYWYFDQRGKENGGLPNYQLDWTNPAYVQRYGPAENFGIDVTGVYVYYPLFTDGGFMDNQDSLVPPQYYNYDHTDHFYAGIITKAATEGYYAKASVRPTFRIYHGYNIANKPVNVSGTDYTNKVNVFDAYGGHDKVGVYPTYDGLQHYINWLSRQYGATVEP